MNKASHLIFDGLHRNQAQSPYAFYGEGCSPTILDKLVKFFDKHSAEFEEITASCYLFNNLILANELRKLASTGVTVNVVSIPLEGYDLKAASSKDFYSFFTNAPCIPMQASRSKADFAQRIYQHCQVGNGMNLHIFDHVYLRSALVNEFSRGRVPFSLHIKSMLIKMRDGTSYSVLTSSNLALRDLVKEELCLIVKNSADDYAYSQFFYQQLMARSKHISGVNLNVETNYSHYREQFESVNQQVISAVSSPESTSRKVHFTAPFLPNSNRDIEAIIKQKIASAKRRVIICAQHINTFDAELKQAMNATNGELNIQILSQTYVDETLEEESNGGRYPKYFVRVSGERVPTRVPSNKKSFLEFIARIKGQLLCQYFVNQDVHLKFIVVDDDVIISTGNFTLTQYVFDQIEIARFENFTGSYQGTFSEVNGYYIESNAAELAAELQQHFERLIGLKGTLQVM